MREVNQRRKKGDYQFVINYYKEKNYEDLSKWDLWNLAFSEYKLNHLEKAYEISQYSLERNKDFKVNINLYSWIVYYRFINDDFFTSKKEEFFKEVKQFIKLNEPKKGSAYFKILFDTLKILKKYGEHEQALVILELVDSDKLCSDPINYNGREYASNLEKYYSYLIQTLYKNKEYSECISAVKEASDKISNYHYNNDAWFLLRKAVSLIELQKYEEALIILHEAAARKEHFVFYQKIGIVYDRLDNYKKALSYYIIAYLIDNNFIMKVNVIGEIAQILEKLKYKEYIVFTELKETIRIEQGWENGETNRKSKDIIKEINDKHIEKIIVNYLDVKNGEINKVFRKNGFIQTKNKSYYYNTFLYDVKEEERHDFFEVESYDLKKNKINTTAFIYR